MPEAGGGGSSDDDDDFVDVPLGPAVAGQRRRSPLPAVAAAAANSPAPASAVSGSRRRAESPASRRRRLLKQSGRSKREEDLATINVGGQRVFIDRLRVSLPGVAEGEKSEASHGAAANSGESNHRADVAEAASAAAGPAPTGDSTSGTSEGDAAARRKRLMAKAPVVPYGPDLMFWGAREKKSTGAWGSWTQCALACWRGLAVF